MPENEQIINRLVNHSAEVITEDELRERVEAGGLTHYIGFEISGYVHIGTGLASSYVIKDLTDLGVQCTVWLADWHTLINEKLDGRLDTAQRIGRGYFAEALKASLAAVGGDPDKLDIRLASQWYDQNWSEYWETVIRVAQHTTNSRMLRSIDIMGRQKGSEVELAKTLYPAMQVADIFYQNIDIAHAGMDQRKAHVIMRDVAGKIAPDAPKPIALHHPLLIGLGKPAQWPIPEDADTRDVIADMKMSKSDPDSAVWVHDAPEEIERKIQKAFAPEREIEYNPVLNWAGHLLFRDRTEPLRIDRKEEHGGDVEFKTFEELETAYADGSVHPMDLKSAVAKELIDLLEPVREHFAKPDVAQKKSELDEILANK